MMKCYKSVFTILYLCIVYQFINCSCYKTSVKEIKNNDSKEYLNLCDHQSCKCTNFLPGATTQWIKINCTFQKQEEVNIIPGSIPSTARELSFYNGHSIKLNRESFRNIEGLEKVILYGFNDALIAEHAFLNLTANHPKVDIEECDRITIETEAFKNSQGPSVNISQCRQVVLQGKMFSNLNEIIISDVGQLDLSESAFTLDSKSIRHHGPNTKITLKKLQAERFPKRVFGSWVGEIHLNDVTVRDIQGDAFSATQYNTVIAINSSFTKIYKQAFSLKTHINIKMEILNCNISAIATEAFLSATDNLTIKNSTLKEVATGAIKMNAAKVTMEDNKFENIHTNGLEFDQWSQITIEGNVFENLERDPIVFNTNNININNSNSFTFIKNGIFKLTAGSLKFISDVEEILPAIKYENTYFNQECECKIDRWLQKVFEKNSTFLQHVMNSSYCTVNEKTLIECYHQENMLIRNFTLETCTNGTNIRCPLIRKNDINNNDVQNSKFLNRKIQIRKEEEAEVFTKKIVHSILIVVSVGILFILIFIIARRTGVCCTFSNSSVTSNNCCLRIYDRMCNMHYGIDTARSISRMSVNEYNENHRLNETRMLDMNYGNRTIEEEQLIEDEIQLFDKATQTLPEELTKELLESLREKLDDPENYSEAREMIEHLYDLIKVEESCNSNNNFVDRSSTHEYIDDPDNLYDIIQLPPIRKKGKNNKTMVSVGTKVPSLEKLTEFSPYMRPTALCHEYFEPRDRALHLYSELPNNHNSNVSYMPDVVGERSSQPLSFLRAIGEKIQPNENVSVSVVGTARSINSAMANRPLPEKPKDLGEGTSFQRE